MKIYLSLELVPEMAGLTYAQKQAVLHYYRLSKAPVPGLRLGEAGFIGLIILAEIAGFIGGFVYWRTPFFGPLTGALIALGLVMVFGYAINMYFTIPKFRRFLQSYEAQDFIRMLKQPKEANAA